MSDGKHNRADRDRERSEEAHWQVAEAGVEGEEERLADDAHQAEEQQDDWENEGGASPRAVEQNTEQGD